MTINVQEACAAQKKYCESRDLPHFAPIDGRCFACHRQIYDDISVETAESELITGCPICHRSYCD